MNLPDKLHMRFDALKSNLSGGQIQRLVIARALLRDKRILLLDEATSAVDLKSEREITARLIAVCKKEKRILIVVTHRTQWLEMYDKLIFVRDHRIAAQGDYRTLQQRVDYEQFIGSLA